jgi:hypothetical protein
MKYKKWNNRNKKKKEKVPLTATWKNLEKKVSSAAELEELGDLKRRKKEN